MEHPYTKLLEELDGARLVRFDKKHRLTLAWKGRTRVEVYNTEGACVDFFGVPEGASFEAVEELVRRYMTEELD